MAEPKWYERIAKSFPIIGNKNSNQVMSRKGYFPPGFAFADFLTTKGQGDLRAVECIRLWKQCTPFFRAVNMRAEAFASIPPRVYDVVNNEYLDDHPVLELLRQPNPVTSGNGFMKALACYYDICGEAFIQVTGDRGSEPLELFVVKPQDVTIKVSDQIGSRGYPGQYAVSEDGSTEYYNLDPNEEGGMFHYWNRTLDRELRQLRDFNPQYGSNNLRGFSKASPLWLQIQQYIEADTNNFSILARGGRPSLAWVWKHDQPMSDEQYTRWKEQVAAYSGAINAGRQLLLDNMELQDIGVNNKDMEFSQNRKTVREEIFNAYGIPLSLVSSETMTMDNLKTGSLLLYDNAVLPLADILFDDLTRLLMHRYDDSENLVITYNPSDIPAIRDRLLAETEREAKLNVLTDNEIRSQIGMEGVVGGDVVYKPAGLIPVESDVHTSDNPMKPTHQDPSEKTVRGKFRKEMRALVDGTGKRIYTDTQIEVMADNQGFPKG